MKDISLIHQELIYHLSQIYRTKFGEYKEYHTSLDNFSLVNVEGLLGGFKIVKSYRGNIKIKNSKIK